MTLLYHDVEIDLENEDNRLRDIFQRSFWELNYIP